MSTRFVVKVIEHPGVDYIARHAGVCRSSTSSAEAAISAVLRKIYGPKACASFRIREIESKPGGPKTRPGTKSSTWSVSR